MGKERWQLNATGDPGLYPWPEKSQVAKFELGL